MTADNATFLSLAQAIHLVYEGVHRLCSTLWSLDAFKQVVKTSSRDWISSQMTS